MEVVYSGGNAIKLAGKNLTLAIDPAGATKADAVLFSQVGGSSTAKADIIIDGPGEYEIKGSNITGVAAEPYQKDSKPTTIYAINLEDVNLAVLGDVGAKLNEAQVDQLGPVDVLILPVGGGSETLTANEAAALVSQIEPRIVIPTHYNDGKSGSKLDKVDGFLQEMGAKVSPIAKAKITQKDLPSETTVIVLESAE